MAKALHDRTAIAPAQRSRSLAANELKPRSFSTVVRDVTHPGEVERASSPPL
jgi:hypothetical protein